MSGPSGLPEAGGDEAVEEDRKGIDLREAGRSGAPYARDLDFDQITFLSAYLSF